MERLETFLAANSGYMAVLWVLRCIVDDCRFVLFSPGWFHAGTKLVKMCCASCTAAISRRARIATEHWLIAKALIYGQSLPGVPSRLKHGSRHDAALRRPTYDVDKCASRHRAAHVP
eukprot:6192061-Pleurochrysis_carterae.AAC.1